MIRHVAQLVAVIFFVLAGVAGAQVAPIALDDAQAVSKTGRILRSSQPSEETLEKLDAARAAYDAGPDDADNIIWYGRRSAYAGEYQKSIAIFTEGIEKHPGDPRMYRHRGHRYITVRDFRAAIADLRYASKLIEGEDNEIEADGLPNAQNIPVSTLHGNIWYHLGLAYYLTQDWDNAYRAFQNGFDISRNDDNIVSTTHWRYMILRRMGKADAATAALDVISSDMNVIENMSYHRLCLFYRGELSLEQIRQSISANSSGAAVAYGVANWHYYNGREDNAAELLNDLLATENWPAFGFIAAEADIAAR